MISPLVSFISLQEISSFWSGVQTRRYDMTPESSKENPITLLGHIMEYLILLPSV